MRRTVIDAGHRRPDLLKATSEDQAATIAAAVHLSRLDKMLPFVSNMRFFNTTLFYLDTAMAYT